MPQAEVLEAVAPPADAEEEEVSEELSTHELLRRISESTSTVNESARALAASASERERNGVDAAAEAREAMLDR